MSGTRMLLGRFVLFSGLLLAVVPFGVAIVVHASGPRPQNLAPPRDLPSLAFHQHLVDLREVDPDQPLAFARYSFTNTSDRPVRITDLEPSCGCLKPQLRKDVYLPGETGEFFLRVQTTTETAGPKEYVVKVRYEDPQPREIDLSFRVTLPERHVVVEPRALLFYQNSSNTTTRTVMISDHRDKPFRVTEVASSSEWVTAEIGSSTVDAKGVRHTEIDITAAGDVASGRHNGVITVTTDDESFRKVQIPVTVMGPSPTGPDGQRLVQLHPRSVTFLAGSPTEQTVRVMLTEKRPHPLKVVNVESSSKDVVVELGEVEPGEEGTWQRSIDVILRAGAPAVSHRCLVTLTTDDANHREIKIPVVIDAGNTAVGPATP